MSLPRQHLANSCRFIYIGHLRRAVQHHHHHISRLFDQVHAQLLSHLLGQARSHRINRLAIHHPHHHISRLLDQARGLHLSRRCLCSLHIISLAIQQSHHQIHLNRRRLRRLHLSRVVKPHLQLALPSWQCYQFLHWVSG